MGESNIVVGSNVYFSREEDPRCDHGFVSQVMDERKLREIEKRRKVDIRIIDLSDIQKKILENGMRCTYAKNDPCWGYHYQYHFITCRCINSECSKIKSCNPFYSDEYAKLWEVSYETMELYGEPGNKKKHRKYYYVDMISEEEMLKYDIFPLNEGLEYPEIKNEILSDEIVKEKKKIRIDLVNGRKMEVIGLEWRIWDGGSYEGEELVEIWGYVEESDAKIEIKKAKKLKKLDNSTEKNISYDVLLKKSSIDVSKICDNIIGEIKLINLNENYFSNNKVYIYLDNQAELSYISRILLANEIFHSDAKKDTIILELLEKYNENNNDGQIMISKKALENMSNIADDVVIKKILECKKIIKLVTPNRDYYDFSYSKDRNRWCCMNMYGITHICIYAEDMTIEKELGKGIHIVLAEWKNNKYSIMLQQGENIGCFNDEFVEMLNIMKKKDKISGLPINIDGIALLIGDHNMKVLGMGNLKFDEY